MAEDSDLEKTESASPRRLEQAREDGQIARSRELATFALLAVGFGGAYATGGSLLDGFASLFRHALIFDRSAGFDTSAMMHRAGEAGIASVLTIGPLLGAMTLAALLAPLALGGWLLSTKALMPQLSRLDPIAGVARLFSVQSLAQLLMAIIKCVIVGSVAYGVAIQHRDEILTLLVEPARIALPHAARLVGICCAATVGAMIVLVGIDVPYQLWQHAKKLRMTKEEVKREFKENEGDPHIKGKIRQQQRAMAQRRMMQQVPKADVIVTNPTHFAVALSYADGTMRAPRVVAKGSDLVAARIRELGAEHGVPVLEAPPLARALFRHTDLNREIPPGLYAAVAEVLAWVYQLRRWREDGGDKPAAPQAVDVPEELRVPADDAALDQVDPFASATDVDGAAR